MKTKHIQLFLFAVGLAFTVNAQDEEKIVNLVGTDGNIVATYDRTQVGKITFNIDPYEKVINGHTFVYMGAVDASGKPTETLWWSVVNLGASTPQEYGDYFAWGEVNTHNYQTSEDKGYSWGNYKWSVGGTGKAFTKYTSSDGLTTLESADDAVTVRWGVGFRMPTKDDYLSLVNLGESAWTWSAKTIADDSHTDAGYTVTSPTTGKSIFIPATGLNGDRNKNGRGAWGDYWASSVDWSENIGFAYRLTFNKDEIKMSGRDRNKGQVVRPVTDIAVE